MSDSEVLDIPENIARDLSDESKYPRIPVAFPGATDMLISLLFNGGEQALSFFNEYFDLLAKVGPMFPDIKSLLPKIPENPQRALRKNWPTTENLPWYSVGIIRKTGCTINQVYSVSCELDPALYELELILNKQEEVVDDILRWGEDGQGCRLDVRNYVITARKFHQSISKQLADNQPGNDIADFFNNAKNSLATAFKTISKAQQVGAIKQLYAEVKPLEVALNHISFPVTPVVPPQPLTIGRLFLGDVVWLYFLEKMGIFKMLGVILDDFARKGRFPVPGNNHVAVVLEAITRQVNMGISSSVRDRNSLYRRCLGWTSDTGRNLGEDSAVNEAFNEMFHKFIKTALAYYREKRIAGAIQQASMSAQTHSSMATVTNLMSIMELLKRSYEPFYYGRNYSILLSGLVWAIGSLSIVATLRSAIGIPESYDKPDKFVPAAYNILVERKPITPSAVNRFKVHYDCARLARDLLLCIESIGDSKDEVSVKKWLDWAEGKVEAYRTSYLNMTGVDLGANGNQKIVQQV